MLKQIENMVCKIILAIYSFKDLGNLAKHKGHWLWLFQAQRPLGIPHPISFHCPSHIHCCALSMGHTNTKPQTEYIIQDSSQNYLSSEPLLIKPHALRPTLY